MEERIWYYEKGGQRYGPLKDDIFLSLMRNG